MKMDLVTIGTLVIFIGMIIILFGILSGMGKGESKVAMTSHYSKFLRIFHMIWTYKPG